MAAAKEYYSSFSNLSKKFNDIDEASNFEGYKRRLWDVETQNFVLDFGSDDAWCAVNLDETDFSALLGEPVSPF
jgi:hypothetical protein